MGGIENYTRDLFAALESRGHTNIVVYSGAELPGLRAEGRITHRLDALTDFDSLRARDNLLELIGAAAPDIAFVHTPINLAAAAAVVGRLPTAYFAHNYGAVCASGAFYYGRGDQVCRLVGVPDGRCLLNAYVQRCNTRRPTALWSLYSRSRGTGAWTRQVPAIVCDSAYVRERHVENGFVETRLHVIPTPVRIPAHVDRARETRGRNVLFVGRITPQKGLAYLVRAFAALSGPTRLIVAGDGYGLSAMQELARRLELESRIDFLGRVSQEEVGELYRRAAVLAVPSVWPEAWGMVGPEAMAHGMPVVAFAVGGIPEWLAHGETGYLVAPKDITALAARLQALLDDVDLGRRLGAEGRRVALDRFTMDRHVDQLMSVFEQISKPQRADAGAVRLNDAG